MSDNVNRIIQKARIGEERAERLLEEMGVMQAEIDRLTAALEDARGKAMPKATVMRSEDLNAVVVHIDGCGPRLAIMCKDEAYRTRLDALAYEIMRVI